LVFEVVLAVNVVEYNPAIGAVNIPVVPFNEVLANP
jgi:hypothetical protein